MPDAVTVATHETEMVPIADLRPHERNYRAHPDDQVDHLAQSLREHGYYRNVVVARDGTILAGHGVVEAAQKIGLEEIPVVRLDLEPNDPKALKVLAGDNELARLAVIDDRLLSELLKEIQEVDVTGLLGTGYDEEMLANLVFVTRPWEEIQTLGDAGQWVGLPEYGQTEIPPRLVISFDSLEERAKFIEEVGIGDQIHKRLVKSPTWSCWWPPRRRQDLASLRFEESEEEDARA